MRSKASRSIRRYTHRDYPMIKEWYERRGKQAPSPAILSDMGYIADERVCGFLYLTNSNMAMIEGIISNPESVPSLRKESLTKLLGYMIDTSLLLGYENIFGLTAHPSMHKQAEKFGFRQIEAKLWAMRETEDAAVTRIEEEELMDSRGYDDSEDY